MRKSDVDGVYLYLALVLGIAEAFFLFLICDVEFGRLLIVVHCIHFPIKLERCQARQVPWIRCYTDDKAR
jgi:hypothetical protein